MQREEQMAAKTIEPRRSQTGAMRAMHGSLCEGKLAEMEQKIASLQHLIAELLVTNQQLRELNLRNEKIWVPGF